MEKPMGIFMMILFGLSGAVIAALAWFYPLAHLDKIEASVAGLIGIGFVVFQGIRLKQSGRADAEQVSSGIQAEDK